MKHWQASWPLWYFFTLFFAACQPIAPIPQAQPTPAETPAQLALNLASDGDVARYTPLEFVVTGIPAIDNPFDASQADLQLTFTSPDGIKTTVGGFWFQPFAADHAQAQSEGRWHARYTPATSGEWHAVATLQPHGYLSNPVTFTVSTDASTTNPHGFVRVDPRNPRFFAFDDGTRFMPVGVNMSWWNDDPIENYTRWLDHFSANGGNTIRVWMANWAFAIEWSDTGLGDYRLRMRQAWLLDELFRLADERGVKIVLVLNHHGQFSKTVNPQWDDNPYNAALGGPITAPEQFADNPAAIALFQQRLRYIVDRWGSAPNLLAWEWWNEYNYTAITESQMQTWLQTMDATLAARDPYNHLVTISGPAGARSPIWQMPGIDFASVHLYTTNDLLTVAPDVAAEYASAVPDKPLWLAEFGYATGEETINSNDKTGIHLHNGLWSTLFSGHAGTGMYWWWDTYIEPLNLWHHYGSLANFLKGLDLAHFTPKSATIRSENPKGTGAAGLLLQNSDQMLLWVRSHQSTAAALDDAYNQAVRQALRNRETLTNFIYTPTPLTGLLVEMEGMTAPTYIVHWYDPQTATWGKPTEVSPINGTLTIPLPTFSHDIAARIEPQE